MKRGLTIVATLLACHALAAQESGPARASLERFTQGLDRYHAAFGQLVISPQGRVLEQGTGEVWMQRPDLFRWRYDGEFPELIVADGQRVWIYDESLEQATVREQSGLAGNSPLMLITDLAGLDEQFIVTEVGESEGRLLLELTVNSNDAEFERVVLGLRGDMLELMVMEDAFGMRTEITFDSAQRNPDIDAERFTVTLPPGTDVIGEADLVEP